MRQDTNHETFSVKRNLLSALSTSIMSLIKLYALYYVGVPKNAEMKRKIISTCIKKSDKFHSDQEVLIKSGQGL